MTPVHMSAKDFRKLTRHVVPKGSMSKSDLMTLHLLIVEAVHGRLTPEQLRSTRFIESRDAFVKSMLSWKG